MEAFVIGDALGTIIMNFKLTLFQIHSNAKLVVQNCISGCVLCTPLMSNFFSQRHNTLIVYLLEVSPWKAEKYTIYNSYLQLVQKFGGGNSYPIDGSMV